METDSLEIQRNQIKKKYSSPINKSLVTSALTLVIGYGTFFYVGLRPKILENPYRNAKSVTEYKLTSEELEKIKWSRERLVSLAGDSQLKLPYIPEDLKEELGELSNKIELRELPVIIEKYAVDEGRTRAKLDVLKKDELVEKYNKWETGKDLIPWLFFSIIGTGLSIGYGILMSYRRRKEISELENKVA